MYAVTVTFTLNPGRASAFLPMMRDNARTSLDREPGCRQFDVCTDPDRPDVVFLYELYDDRAAFDAHLAAPHFQSFDAATQGMVAIKDVVTFAEVWQ